METTYRWQTGQEVGVENRGTFQKPGEGRLIKLIVVKVTKTGIARVVAAKGEKNGQGGSFRSNGYEAGGRRKLFPWTPALEVRWQGQIEKAAADHLKKIKAHEDNGKRMSQDRASLGLAANVLKAVAGGHKVDGGPANFAALMRAVRIIERHTDILSEVGAEGAL